jgi:hypothetical protein
MNYTFPVDRNELNDARAFCQYLTRKGNRHECTTTLEYDGYFDGCDSSTSKGMIFEAVCVGDRLQVAGVVYPKEHLSYSISSLDGIAIMIFIVGIIWIQYMQKIETADADTNNCTASDYTVVCYTLPENHLLMDQDSLKKYIRKHFEDKLSTPDDTISVADINFSSTADHYLQAAFRRAFAAQLVDKVIAQIHSHKDQARRDLYRDSLKRALLKFEVANDECLKYDQEAQRSMHAAYITFADENSYLRCVKTYRNAGFLTPLIQDRYLKMDGKVVTLTIIDIIFIALI